MANSEWEDGYRPDEKQMEPGLLLAEDFGTQPLAAGQWRSVGLS
jgi:hypothetical protein